MIGRSLVLTLVLVDERSAVEPEEIAVGPQEALDVDRARQQVPFLVLDRPQVLGPDLRSCLDLADVDPRTHPGFAQCLADVGHSPEGYRRFAG